MDLNLENYKKYVRGSKIVEMGECKDEITIDLDSGYHIIIKKNEKDEYNITKWILEENK